MNPLSKTGGKKMSQIQSIKFVSTRSKDSGETRQLLNPSDYKQGDTIADLIRRCKKQHPTASNGEIGRFLTEFTGKFVRTQWVFNVLANPPKRK
jgi:hypothetical protein